MTFAEEQIEKLFTDPQNTMENGLWFSGVEGEGLYKNWHENGQLWEHCNYENYQLEGPYKRWYKNGQLLEQCNYKNNLRNGLYKTWYENSQLWVQCTCKHINGKSEYVDEYQSWNESGKRVEHRFYDNKGKEVKGYYKWTL